MSAHYDVIVVGNGAIGATIALQLGLRGHRVARVGDRARPLAASAAAGAMLGSFSEVTRNTLKSKYGRLKLESDIQASQLWSSWDELLSEHAGESDSLYAARGTVVLLNTIGTRTVDTGNYEAIRAALHEYEQTFEDIDPDTVAWYSPEQLSRSLKAIYIPDEHGIDASRLLAKLDLAFLRNGGTLIESAAKAVTVAGDTCTGIVLNDSTELKARTVVVAAGAQSLTLLDALAEARRRIPPLLSGYGVSALVRTEDGLVPEHVLRTPNRAFACGLHCVPRADGGLYLGGTNVITEQPRTHATIRDLQFLLECGVNQLHANLPMASVEAVQVGNRPVTADGFPLIGSAGTEGLFLATGTYRDGLHQSPLIAEYISDLVEAKTSRWSTLLGDFAPQRAPLISMDRNDVITNATEELVAAGYETDWNLKPEWPLLLEQNARETYSRRAENLHPAFTPPPELLAKMTPSIERRLVDYYQVWS